MDIHFSYYNIADFVVAVKSHSINPLDEMRGFAFFRFDSCAGHNIVLHFDMTASTQDVLDAGKVLFSVEPTHLFSFSKTEDEQVECSFYAASDCREGNTYAFKMKNEKTKAELYFYGNEENGGLAVISNALNVDDPDMCSFAIWMAFNLAVVKHNAVAIHSSVVEYKGKGVLCLGESGTGKSTHTKLWRKNFKEAKLLNDDSPVVKIEAGNVFVCGSPWSGKLPCYKNLKLPVAAFIRISQAKINKMTRLATLPAIGALYPSCPPAFSYDARLSDLVCGFLSEVLKEVPVYQLECLPDDAAAILSRDTIFSGVDNMSNLTSDGSSHFKEMTIPNVVFMENLEELISSGQDVRITVKGISMWPTFKDMKDSVVLSSVDNSAVRRGDVVLFRRCDGNKCLHRIIHRQGNLLKIRGDGVYGFFEETDVQGVIAIVKSGTFLNCNNFSSSDFKWKCWSIIVMLSYPFRLLLIKVDHLFRK